VAFNPKSNALASAHYDGTAKVWDLTTGEMLLDIPAHADAVQGVAYSADGRLLASAGGRDRKNNLGIWDAATGKPIHGPFPQGDFLRSVAFSPDGRCLAFAVGDWVSILAIETGEELLRTPPGDRVFRVVFSPDGRRLATAGEGQTVRLLDPVSGQELAALRVSGGELWSVAFSPKGDYLATCSGHKGKGTIQLWDASMWEKSPLGSPQ
jgi:WD40 repeat protein